MSTKVTWIPVAKLISFHQDENVSRAGDLFKNEQDQAELALSLARDGYELRIGNPLTVYTLDESRQGAAVSQVTEELAAAKLARNERKAQDGDTPYTVSPHDYMSALVSTKTVKGKVVQPTTGVVDGHRRLESVVYANALRDKMGLEPIREIPCLVQEYASDLERFTDCIRGNTTKNLGTRTLSLADELMGSSRQYAEGAKEADIMRALGGPRKRGAAQKHHAVCRLDRRAKHLGLLDGIVTGAIPFGPIMAAATRDLAKEIEGGLDPQTLEVEDVVTRISKKGAGTNDPKMASKDAINSASQSPVDIIDETLRVGVIGNDLGRLARYIPYAPQINAAIADIVSRKPDVSASPKK